MPAGSKCQRTRNHASIDRCASRSLQAASRVQRIGMSTFVLDANSFPTSGRIQPTSVARTAPDPRKHYLPNRDRVVPGTGGAGMSPLRRFVSACGLCD